MNNPEERSGDFPVVKSLLEPKELSRRVTEAYHFPITGCQLLSVSMRDIYVLTGQKAERFLLIVYRHNQRTPEQIRSEWEFVCYLESKGVPVAPAFRQGNGEFLLSFAAPEGTRYGVLTTFIPGKHLRQRYSADASRLYGRAIAQLHTLADSMPLTLDRPANDYDFIVGQGIVAIETILLHRPADLTFLREAVAILQPRFAALPRQTPYFGMIHGDVIRANAQVSEDGQVTVLDFDLCGPGWRAYDVASYLEVAGQPEAMQAFLEGYEQIRPLSDTERGWLPLFRAARNIFELGIPALNAYHWGSAYLSDREVDTALDSLKRNLEMVTSHPVL
jgi:Ser/Thr protein kinase RdoA (MazF antagonist)